MKRILLLLTILMAAFPIKSHAVVIDTLWTKHIGIPSVGTLRFVNDSMAITFITDDATKTIKISSLNINTKVLEEKLTFPAHDSKYFSVEQSKDRKYILFKPFKYQKVTYIIKTNPIQLFDSISFSSSGETFVSTKDSICYIRTYDSIGINQYQNKLFEYNYLSKNIIRSNNLPFESYFYCFVPASDSTAIVQYVMEEKGSKPRSYVNCEWINLKTFTTIRNIYKTYTNDIDYFDITVNPNGKNWVAKKIIKGDEGNIVNPIEDIVTTDIMSTENDSVLYSINDLFNTMYFNSGDYLIADSTNVEVDENDNIYNHTLIIDLSTMTPVYSISGYYPFLGFDDICPDDSKYISGTSFANYSGQALICLNKIDWTKVSRKKTVSKPILFPNPTNGILRLDMLSNELVYDKIEIISLSGEKILEFIPNESKKEIDISDLPKGIYFVSFITGAKLVNSAKLIKE